MHKLTKTAYHNMSKSDLVDFAWQLKNDYNELRSLFEYQEKLLTLTREQVGNIRTGVGEQYQIGFIQVDNRLSTCVDESTQVLPCACVFSSTTTRRG